MGAHSRPQPTRSERRTARRAGPGRQRTAGSTQTAANVRTVRGEAPDPPDRLAVLEAVAACLADVHALDTQIVAQDGHVWLFVVERATRRRVYLSLAYAERDWWIVSQSGMLLAHVSDPARAGRYVRGAMA
ncbi:hypothetical protein J4573_52945 [Actinomadura barringtoniae]|uniref:Uncharacterized protein n=1 Tax=Actinomadura barringtoniae TaxID=1427535 RepID=A0A939PNZ8_9ACTN|nr:hypothetical protein [Actinomadura barringtoniae]MBO2455867.1 hypothetical protein [Actinomadura barringtoniae]